MEPPNIQGVNLLGLKTLLDRHPEVEITTKYGNWVVLHASHVLATMQAAEIHPALAETGEQIHEALDEAMEHHSVPNLETEFVPWESPVTVTLSATTLVQCAMSLAGMHLNVKMGAVEIVIDDEAPISAIEMIAQADLSFQALLVEVDPEFPMVVEMLYEER